MEGEEKVLIKMKTPRSYDSRDFVEELVDEFISQEENGGKTELTKKERAIDDIMRFVTDWCVSKISTGGCDKCPMNSGDNTNYCMINTLVESIYSDSEEAESNDR